MRSRIVKLLKTDARRFPMYAQILENLGNPEELKDADLGDLLVHAMLAQGVTKGNSSITKELIERVDGKVNGAFIDVKQSKATDEKERAIEFYTQVLESDNATLSDKMRARERLDILLGLVADTGDTFEKRVQQWQDFMDEAENSTMPKEEE